MVVVVVVWELGNSVQQMQLLASNVTQERETETAEEAQGIQRPTHSGKP
jgi:hypothetical protein